jgi:hypothetical protein
MSGFNTLMYYSSTLFALVGFSNPVAVGLVVAGVNFIMTWVSSPTIHFLPLFAVCCFGNMQTQNLIVLNTELSLTTYRST